MKCICGYEGESFGGDDTKYFIASKVITSEIVLKSCEIKVYICPKCKTIRGE